MTKTSTSTMTAFLSQFLSKYKLSAEIIEHALSKTTSETLNKGAIFSAQGKICEKIGILVSGLLYASFQPENEIDEKVSRFFYVPKNIVVTSFESYARVQPSTESIIALEQSYLLCIKKSDLDSVYEISPEINRLGRELAEESYIQASQRARSLQVMSAKERIADFRKNHKQLVNHPSIQLQQVASYLGMNRNLYTKLASKC